MNRTLAETHGPVHALVLMQAELEGVKREIFNRMQAKTLAEFELVAIVQRLQALANQTGKLKRSVQHSWKGRVHNYHYKESI